MAVSVHTPSPEAAVDLAGTVRLSNDRFFQTRVTVVNLARGSSEFCDVRTAEDACVLSWSTLRPIDLDVGTNEILVGADAPEGSASTTILVTRIATGAMP